MSSSGPFPHREPQSGGRFRRAGWLTLMMVATLFPSTSLLAQAQSPDTVWREIPRIIGFSAVVPQTARLVGADVIRLSAQLAAAPVDTGLTAGSPGIVIFLPAPPGMAVGRYIRVRVQESPVLPANLAERFPTFRTYFGQGIDDPSVTTRFEVTPAGVRGIVSSSRGEFVIEPRTIDVQVDQRAGDVLHVAAPKARMRGDTVRRERVIPRPVDPEAPARRGAPADRAGVQRTVRLAVVATKEYTAFHRRGAPNASAARDSALLSLARTINLVQRAYQVDLGIRFTFVNEARSLVFAGSDPFPDRSLSAIRARNQHVIDSIVGAANYDLGHVLTTTDGGEAVVGSICDSATKAMGLSGLPAPVETEPFAIDYVAHELGHQFGANHTFNANVGSCGGNRKAIVATEPGSGSTIMSYAGICNPLNVQPHADSYFHIVSLAEIGDRLASVSCLGTLSTGNRAPEARTPRRDIFVPVSTPFMLVGSASDLDDDPLRYTWEQVPGTEWDPAPMPPEGDVDGKIRPLFRSFAPSVDTVRYLPSLARLARQYPVQFEALPSRAHQDGRGLEFQFTARDGRGGIGTAATTVHAVGARPFKVTAPAAGTAWSARTQVTVRWNVAGTDAAPISCSTVDVRLSADGGGTFPTTLASSLPNTGSATLTLGEIAATSNARVMVACSEQTFFNTSPVFRIR